MPLVLLPGFIAVLSWEEQRETSLYHLWIVSFSEYCFKVHLLKISQGESNEDPSAFNK